MWEDDDFDRALWNTMGIIEHSANALRPGQPLSTIEVGEKFVTIVFDLPGVQRDEVLLTCTEDKVTVEAEVRRRSVRGGGVAEGYARYSKQVVLPVRVVSEKGTARFKNGMIIVKLPRRLERNRLKEPGKRLKLSA